MDQLDKRRRAELGDFLRARREQLDPEALGIIGARGEPARGTRRRRTPGLRREEVAESAGIGVDWYIRLEQGRDVTPSVTTVDALARALRLRPTEHAHLRALARARERRAFVLETVPETIRRIVEDLTLPAYVTGRRWDILAWNAAATELFVDFAAKPVRDRNILLYMFTDPGARRLFGEYWEPEARRMIAQFRATHDFWADDPAFLDLRERLRSNCPEFSSWWETHDIRATTAGHKILNHVTKGRIKVDYATFQANEDQSLKLVICTIAP